VIEECPAPGLSDELRQAIREAGVRAARAVDYESAGTVEFLLDKSGEFYFLEMNTRIQVEHPVTEEATGYDLLKEQIRIAAGEPLSIPDGVPLLSHALECRINAEDPENDFRPAPGRITTFHPPGGPGVRVDTHVYAGYVVPPYYDSLIAKLIVRAPTRDEAIQRADLALDMFVIEGVHTTIPFLRRVLEHPDFREGNIDTRFLERFPAPKLEGAARP
jgi:acetyl-CoA carboxylase biotin carboxylase subunit